MEKRINATPTGPMRVLLAVDGSEPAELAVELVAGAAWPASTEILVAEAIQSPLELDEGPWPALAMFEVERIEDEIRAEGQRTVDAIRQRLVHPGLIVDAEMLGGRAATAIIDRARAMPADLIVMGSRGHGTIASMLIGSVSAEVVDHAACPVLIARGRDTQRVLLAWDGSSGAAAAADLITRWPLFGGTEVRVLSVADVGYPWWTGFPQPGSAELTPIYIEAAKASRKQHEALATEMAARLRDDGVLAEGQVREGDAAAEILAASVDWKTDLIVMGTRGRTGLRRVLLGSVARNVLQHATCSVLVVHEPDQPGAPTRG